MYANFFLLKGVCILLVSDVKKLLFIKDKILVKGNNEKDKSNTFQKDCVQLNFENVVLAFIIALSKAL